MEKRDAVGDQGVCVSQPVCSFCKLDNYTLATVSELDRVSLRPL